ncbi:acyl transferase [Flavobacteriaceae bacterium F08102]|nr:acyl transferase [Flavobacteriaceae bacterium F08102]
MYMPIKNIFHIQSKTAFEKRALEIFNYQFQHNQLYQQFIKYLKIDPNSIQHVSQIPFLPIQFFKSHRVLSNQQNDQIVFSSSGTTGTTSKHHVTDVQMYIKSYRKGFNYFYGNIEEFTVLALLPAYLERSGSSLVYMVNDFIKQSKQPESGFYLHNHDVLAATLKRLDSQGKKVLLIGVTFALLDLIDLYKFKLNHTIVMETGGMKGRRKEITREELHQKLKRGFGVDTIHSEYGMTELLSQAYSQGAGIFTCPPWMRVLIRDPEDPLSLLPTNQTGGVNIIDLANVNSCAFIATQDLGKIHNNEQFEILGRFDHADIRGCNLLTN